MKSDGDFGRSAVNSDAAVNSDGVKSPSEITDRRPKSPGPVSGGQCHLNHLTTLRSFSWPNLAYMCTKVA